MVVGPRTVSLCSQIYFLSVIWHMLVQLPKLELLLGENEKETLPMAHEYDGIGGLEENSIRAEYVIQFKRSKLMMENSQGWRSRLKFKGYSIDSLLGRRWKFIENIFNIDCGELIIFDKCH